MAETPSTMTPLGASIVPFSLPDGNNKLFHLDDFKNDIMVIMFICNHCPYVIHILPTMVKVTDNYISKHIDFIAINSNDVENYPEDGPHKMVKLSRKMNFGFPYLFDESQDVAKTYKAACTPDFFVYYKKKLAYRGRFDASRPTNGITVTGDDLKMTLDTLLKGEKPQKIQYPSMGCNIKWK